MGMKMGLVVGLGVGYVLGTRAGREQYDKIRTVASKVRRVPIVAKPLDAAGAKASDIVRAQGERVTDKVADMVKERLFGAPASSSSMEYPAHTTYPASPPAPEGTVPVDGTQTSVR
ncbi:MULTISPECIES: YtxH domain-containing protein [unclassified Schaalia]|uniref:YtxH domain-containing protein n=1 Tax=unclassified Schaalia TaxID=2691889 RepID=UPI001E466ED7|nr:MULTISPECIES: YtxH domain-containing protein [unclassified Schaalia]